MKYTRTDIALLEDMDTNPYTPESVFPSLEDALLGNTRTQSTLSANQALYYMMERVVQLRNDNEKLRRKAEAALAEFATDSAIYFSSLLHKA